MKGMQVFTIALAALWFGYLCGNADTEGNGAPFLGFPIAVSAVWLMFVIFTIFPG